MPCQIGNRETQRRPCCIRYRRCRNIVTSSDPGKRSSCQYRRAFALNASILLLQRQVQLKRFAEVGEGAPFFAILNGSLPPIDALRHHHLENHSPDPQHRHSAASRRPQKMHKMRDKTGKAAKTKGR